MFLEPEHVLHHRQPHGYLTPSQGGSYLSSRQRAVTDMVFRVKSHVYALEGQDCQYKQMFGTDLRGAVSLPCFTGVLSSQGDFYFSLKPGLPKCYHPEGSVSVENPVCWRIF